MRHKIIYKCEERESEEERERVRERNLERERDTGRRGLESETRGFADAGVSVAKIADAAITDARVASRE